MLGDVELQDRQMNCRLLIEESENPLALDPIVDYTQAPLVSLIDACAPLTDNVDEILSYANVALEKTSKDAHGILTHDESASICLYTMESDTEHVSLYRALNRTLKAPNRENLRPWFKYLKLLLTALAKLPCMPPQAVWRGVRRDVSAEFTKGAHITWWTFSSTTKSLSVLESDLYLGTVGDRTLFSIEILNGRDICNYSYYNTEEEILLLPGTYMEVQSKFNPAPGLHIVHLKQKVPEQPLIALPFEGIV